MSKDRSSNKLDANKTVFTLVEVTTLLNNAVTMCRRPAGFEPDGIPASRAVDLRKFAEALLDTVEELIGEEYLRPQEAVFALVSLALMIQMKHVNGSAARPTGVVSQRTLDAIKAFLKEEQGS